MDTKDNLIQDRSIDFSVRIVKLYRYLINNKKEKILCSQILKSGTSIGANVAESRFAVSKSDFVNKMQTALKEAYETSYWLTLFFKTDIVSLDEYNSINAQCEELIKILSSIIKSLKE
jgi:four helix bundle protein